MSKPGRVVFWVRFGFILLLTAGRSTPMPASIDNVLLVDSRDESAVYTSDFSSGGSIVAGVVVGLAVALILIVVKWRHDAKFRRGVPAPLGHP